MLIVTNITPNPKSYAPEIMVDGLWLTNTLRFATPAEAQSSATDVFMRWQLVTSIRVRPTQDAPNHRVVDHNRLEKI